MNDLIYIIGVPIVVIISALFLSKLKKSGVFNEEDIEGTIKKTLGITELILNSVDSSQAFQNKTKFIIDLSYDVVDFINTLSDENKDKVEASLEIVNEILTMLKVNVSESEQRLIELTIRDGLNALEKL